MDKPVVAAKQPALLELEPGAVALAEVVRVIDCDDAGQPVWFREDATAQQALVFTRALDEQPVLRQNVE